MTGRGIVSIVRLKSIELYEPSMAKPIPDYMQKKPKLMSDGPQPLVVARR